MAAQQDVVDAEQELADAEAALAAVEGRRVGPGDPGGIAEPDTAGAGGDGQPRQAGRGRLRRGAAGHHRPDPADAASQQFNAAAVALEMSWLRLFADAGCLTDEQQKQAEAAVQDYTTTLQKSLRDAGYYKGEVDGVYGPATVEAVQALQKAHGLPVTGTVDKATAAALQADLRPRAGPPHRRRWPPPPPSSRRSSSPGSGTDRSTAPGRRR